MAEVPNPKWYDEGTVALTQGSPAVTGTGTFWVSAGVKVGDIFVDANGMIYEITAVNDSTSLTLGKNYTGATGSGKGYSIIRVFNSTMNSTLANRIATLMSEFEQRYDLDMQTITPKNAYDIAKDNGFTGTESDWLTSLNAYGIAKSNGFTGTKAEWLESLKAAGEWSTLDARTSILTANTPELHNSIAGFRNKGTVLTDEQKTAITSGTFDDLYIGDFWIINGHTYFIAKFTSNNNIKIMMLSNILYNAPMNETDTNEGGYYNSWMYSEGLRQAGEIIATDFGDLVKSFSEYVPNTNLSGYFVWGMTSTNQTIAAQTMPYKCMIPTYKMLYGRSFTRYPQDWYCYHSNTQLPIALFEARRYIMNGGGTYWLQECYNATDTFLLKDANGITGWDQYKNKASTLRGVRVVFFIG